MTVCAVAHLRGVTMGPPIVRYLERIDTTLAPFGGRFLVHGGDTAVLEGSWPGDLVIIAIPDRAQARAWYGSRDHQRILPLRTGNAEGDVVIASGVSEDHRATDVLGRLP